MRADGAIAPAHVADLANTCDGSAVAHGGSRKHAGRSMRSRTADHAGGRGEACGRARRIPQVDGRSTRPCVANPASTCGGFVKTRGEPRKRATWLCLRMRRAMSAPSSAMPADTAALLTDRAALLADMAALSADGAARTCAQQLARNRPRATAGAQTNAGHSAD
jgi:hypothetical protein